MAEFPAFPLWTDAYLGDTNHLTTIEHGAYLLLLITMWRSKTKSLPDDDKMLARYARLTKAQWARMKPVLRPFFDVENGAWAQGRLTDEAEAVRRHSRLQSNKARARWLKNKTSDDAGAMPRECPHTHTQDSEANASGADAPERPLVEIIFGPGLRLLTSNGVEEKAARSVLGKWRRDHGDEALLAALGRAQREGALDPVGFIEGCLRAVGQRKGKANERFARKMEMANRFDAGRDGNGSLDNGEGGGAAVPLLPARSIRGR